MTKPKLRILSQIGDATALKLPPDLSEQVEVVSVPPNTPVPEGLHGDVLLMAHGNTAIYALAERGVRWVHFIGTGINAFDLPRLVKDGRTFTNSRGAVAVPISEWVLAVLLHHEKQLSTSFVHAAPDRWPPRVQLGTLYGRQLALLGFGAIGVGVAKRALPFGAQVRALRHTSVASPVSGVELVRSFDALIDGADHLILAAPLTAATRHILDAEALAKVKHGVHVVNVARGELIDQDALRVALDDGRVAAASLDAVTPEPLPAGHWLYEHPRVHLSPHISWNWPDSHSTVVGIFADNLRRFLAGERLENVIDPEVGY
ncbi:MAG: NAD(P)-dependent oxidoreductase [Polyangiales bacterium]